MSTIRKVVSMAVASVIAVGVLVPALASAKKTVKVNMTQTAKVTGIKLTGTVTGKPFGKCKVTGTVTPPKVTAKWKCKGGTITLKTTDATIVGSNFISTSKLSGTGKYKGLKGKTKNKGSVASAKGTFIGTASY